MRERTLFRIKSPQLYQLSYRPKSTQPLAFSESSCVDVISCVPVVYPITHRGRYHNRSTAADAWIDELLVFASPRCAR